MWWAMLTTGAAEACVCVWKCRSALLVLLHVPHVVLAQALDELCQDSCADCWQLLRQQGVCFAKQQCCGAVLLS